MQHFTDEEIIFEMVQQDVPADRQDEGIRVIRESILKGKSEIPLQDAVRILKKYIDLDK